jgi:hypothetical protein
MLLYGDMIDNIVPGRSQALYINGALVDHDAFISSESEATWYVSLVSFASQTTVLALMRVR